MLKKLTSAVLSRVPVLTYLLGAAMISLGASFAYPPAGLIVGGLLLIALVIETGR